MKDNVIFKLDLLEYKLRKLQSQPHRSRYPKTHQLFNVKSGGVPSNVSRITDDVDQLNQQVNDMYQEIMSRKTFHMEKKLQSIIKKFVQDTKFKELADITDAVVNYKVCKEVTKKVLNNAALKKDPPQWFASTQWYAMNDKDHKQNPGKLWNDVLKKHEKVVSKFYGDTKVKEILTAFDKGMDLVLNNKKKEDEKKEAEKEEEQDEDEAMENEADSESDDDSEQDISESAAESDEEDDSSSEVPEGAKLLTEEELMAQYEGMLAASSDEDNNSVSEEEINYNEVTDEEPSEEEVPSKKRKLEQEQDDDFFEQPKHKLPSLMGGYYSGGSDDEVEEFEKPVKEKKKNRRGQRARQKIWEQKYGRKAKHVVKEKEERQAERDKRQKEYEERVAKRAAKAAGSGANMTPIGDRVVRPDTGEKAAEVPAPVAPVKEVHPSWEAKKLQEQKQQAKFAGKKIVF